MEDLLGILVFKGYLVFFVWILVNRLGVPVPATPALLAAGALAGMGEWRIALVLALAVVATLASDTVWFQLGRRYGSRILRLLCRVAIEPDTCARRAEDFLARHGASSLLITKFIPGMNRTVLPLTGTAHVSYGRFLVFDFFGALIWAGAYSGLGYAFSDTIEEAVRHSKSLGWYAAAAFALAIIVGYIAIRELERRRKLAGLQVERVTPSEVRHLLDTGKDVAFVDLRHPLEWNTDPRVLPGAICIPPSELEQRHVEIPRDREIILYCT